MTIKVIQNVVCEHFKIKESDFLTKTRERRIVFPRQISMYLSVTHTNESLAEIGYLTGKKHHTTVLYSYRLISDLKKRYKSIAKVIKKLNGKIETLKNQCQKK